MTLWQSAVQPVVEEILHTQQAVPGIKIAVERHGASIEYLAAGKDAAGQPLTAGSLFPVASITKLATALAVLRLVTSGRRRWTILWLAIFQKRPRPWTV